MSLPKVLTSMWLGFIWLCFFLLHILTISIQVPETAFLQFFDQLVFYSCFLIYGLIDTPIFDSRTVVAISTQFVFWWGMGVGVRFLYHWFIRDFKKIMDKSKS